MTTTGDAIPAFGAAWTERKLDIIENYLNAYTTVMKRQAFRLLYIDAFAGTGAIHTTTLDPDGQAILRGSAARAAAVTDRPFDEILLIEKDSTYCRTLDELRAKHRERNIRIVNDDANAALRRLSYDWQGCRGVLFLDPFATQVDWQTIEAIAATKALDTWILFPVSAIRRLLPRRRTPDHVNPKWADCLSRVYGGSAWRDLYRPSPQLSLFGTSTPHSDPGVKGLLRVYRQQLQTLVGERLLSSSARLGPRKGPPLFELLFFAGNPRGIRISHDIASYLVGTKQA